MRGKQLKIRKWSQSLYYIMVEIVRGDQILKFIKDTGIIFILGMERGVFKDQKNQDSSFFFVVHSSPSPHFYIEGVI